MASRASLRRPAPYNYETPEQKARDQLRAQKTIAGVTTRANEQAQSVAALQALAKATGVPMSELPAGGIHNGMSPADVQAATDRINGWVSRQPGGIPPRQSGAQGPTGQPTMSQVAAQNLQGTGPAQTPTTRTTPTGGTETLVQSESGPRWVASVNNAPAPNNLNGQVTRDPGGRTVQVQPNPIALRPTQPGQPAATVAQNRDFYANPTSPVPTPKPWAPSPDVITPTADAARIAFQYGDKTGGMVTNGPSAPGVKGYAGTGAGAPPYVPPAVVSRVAAATTPTPPAIAVTAKPVVPSINPATGNAIPGLPPNAGTVPAAMTVATPPVSSPIPGMPPITGANPAAPFAPTTGKPAPFNPDADDEENRKRLALVNGASRPPASAPSPYQF